ncbi:family 43 glycosylhydrolase [Dietzia sp. PP-33]|jgi:arabinan endo-1,5-alpha-L-arabinosidase|uniref:family 43 glycosylhydrolase n=1 Tax=Dietzia sp. PP-33 TaxID=2957500 RepID=UPI0029A8FD85|nr:family 43 glycosylhydrolase [Dietzia sp. PP-33]MDX2356895.1 family 43 glycosylhydrolase [Dietzia sp. PP-33]
MKTPRGARALGAAALAVVVPLVSATAAVPAAANPVISSIAPDPSVQRGADGAFHVYASSDDWSDGAGYRLIPHFRSFDLVEWEYVGDAFTTRPTWASAGSFLWAPDVHVTDAGAVMYYTTGGQAPCIGMATAPGIEGPWTHGAAPIVCFGADEPYQDLDPMDPEVVWTEGGPVMLMGNFEGIHAVPMNAAGTALDGDPVLVAGTGVEAPAVVSREGTTHLFTSAGLCCDGERSQYRVLGGRADDVMGPYTDRQRRPLVQGPDAPLPGDVILEGDDDWVGPGHVDVTTDDAGQDWMLYHAAPRGSAVLPGGLQRRYMMLDRLDWIDGWPVVGDGTPSSTRPADPVVTLPVRLTAVGGAALRPDRDGQVLDASVRMDSTGSAYSGELRASITGPSKQRVGLPIVVGDQQAQSVPAVVAAGQDVTRALTFRPTAPLSPGRYELVVSVGDAGGPVRELAVFGLEVAPDGSLSMGSGALGSATLGSLGG